MKIRHVLVRTGLGALILLAANTTASARSIQVTTTADASGGPECSLRDAITAANTDSSTGGCPGGNGHDVIQLAAGETYPLAIPGRDEDGNLSGDLDVAGRLTLQGHGSTIDAGGLDRGLHVQPGSDVRIHDLAVVNGDVSGPEIPNFGNDGGGLLVVGATVRGYRLTVSGNSGDGGGINCRAGCDLTLHGSEVAGNLSEPTFAGGGGIRVVSSALALFDTWVHDNSVVVYPHDGGGILCQEGSGCRIVDSLVSGNTAPEGGGGFACFESACEVTSSTVSGNVGGDGGGIICDTSDSPALLVVDRSTVSDNLATVTDGLPRTGNGGGILILDGCQALIVNSTISGNSTGPGNPGLLQGLCGGILVAGETAAARAELVNSTVTDNSAVLAGGVATLVVAAAGAGTETVFENTIVAGNSALVPGTSSCFKNSAAAFHTSLGHNLEDSATCGFTGPGDQVLSDPLLGPLADNGGPTRTHALGAGSPAIDAADDATCQSPPVDGVDQRGVARPQGGGCDIGAYEAE